jgi:hypothetical protein
MPLSSFAVAAKLKFYLCATEAVFSLKSVSVLKMSNFAGWNYIFLVIVSIALFLTKVLLKIWEKTMEKNHQSMLITYPEQKDKTLPDEKKYLPEFPIRSALFSIDSRNPWSDYQFETWVASPVSSVQFSFSAHFRCQISLCL